MKIRKALVAAVVPLALLGAACGSQDGCYDDGERVSCNQGDDDDDDDDEDWGDDD